jgi:hypothetical protein
VQYMTCFPTSATRAVSLSFCNQLEEGMQWWIQAVHLALRLRKYAYTCSPPLVCTPSMM